MVMSTVDDILVARLDLLAGPPHPDVQPAVRRPPRLAHRLQETVVRCASVVTNILALALDLARRTHLMQIAVRQSRVQQWEPRHELFDHPPRMLADTSLPNDKRK